MGRKKMLKVVEMKKDPVYEYAVCHMKGTEPTMSYVKADSINLPNDSTETLELYLNDDIVAVFSNWISCVREGQMS